jgi:tetratricopeptide (TPR) repeat protein
MEGDATTDFFISYSAPDRPWAEWIAWQLETNGIHTKLQAWDFRPGNNFILEMQAAAATAHRTLAVLSPAFLESSFTRPEWAAAFAEDPTGDHAKLVPVRVRDCRPEGLLGPIVYIDLVGTSEAQAAEALLAGVRSARALPTTAPAFPGPSSQPTEPRAQFPGSLPPIWNVPVGTRLFEGRVTTLSRLAETLARDGAAAVTQMISVHGLGGVGKTQVAARYARDHQGSYDIVWWVRSEEDAIRLSDYASLGAALGLPEAAEQNQADLVAATAKWLARAGRWLLIFDNAPSPQVIADLIPERSGGHVLITSRRHADWRILDATPLPLDVWGRAESVAFLAKRTSDTDADAADAVAEALGDLPLALEQAAAYTNQQVIGLQTYYERLSNNTAHLMAKGQPTDYEHTVTTTWNLAFESLEAPAPELLAMCVFLAPERIPLELINGFAAQALSAQGLSVEPHSIEDAIEQLLGYALITPSGQGSVDIHRLVQQIVRNRHSSTEQRRFAGAALGMLSAALPPECWRAEHWPKTEQLLPHVLAVTEHTQSLDTATDMSTAMMLTVAQSLCERAELSTAKDLCERALVTLERSLGPDAAEIAATLGELGNVLGQSGELREARAALERALTIKEKHHGPDDIRVASTLGNLGNVLADLGELTEALHFLERTLTIEESEDEPDDSAMAITLGNLGSVLAQLGRLDEARVIVRRSLETKERINGPEHHEVAIALVNLGIILRRSDELEDARTAEERALPIIERVYGSDHPAVAKVLGNLGNILSDLNEGVAARQIQERALAIEERAYGPDHHEVAKTLVNLGRILRAGDELEEARTTLERALTIEERVYGKDHIEVATTLINLSQALALMGEFSDARVSAERALTIEEHVYAPDHADIARTRSWLRQLD